MEENNKKPLNGMEKSALGTDMLGNFALSHKGVEPIRF